MIWAASKESEAEVQPGRRLLYGGSTSTIFSVATDQEKADYLDPYHSGLLHNETRNEYTHLSGAILPLLATVSLR